MIEISVYTLQSLMYQSGAIGFLIGFISGLMLIAFLVIVERKKVAIFLKNLLEGKQKNKIIEELKEYTTLSKALAEETNTSFMRGNYHDILEIVKEYKRKKTQ